MPAFGAVLAALDRDERVRGKQFERVCSWYLQNDPVYRQQVRRVWLWKEWPGRWGSDAGIDLVAELRDGSLMAVQAKAYGDNYWVTKSDVDSFLSESARPKFSRRLLIATTNHIGATALRTLRAQKVSAKFLALADLGRAQVDWPASPDDLRPRRLPPKRPRPHQRSAVQAVRRGFAKSDRGKLVMACGTGKTLVGLWVAERLRSQRTLLLFPSLTLLAQALREWTANSSRPFETLAVCSDATVYGQDAFVEHTSDLDIRVTTDAKAIGAFLRGRGQRVVFATYQSSDELAKAMKVDRVPAFDLAIADEAHRCAGPLAGEFATILDAKAIRAARRLFMTATPRYFTGRIKREAAEADYELASMDDDAHFGPVFHGLSFGAAIAKKLLSDYQVVIVGIDDATYRGYAQRGVFVTTDGKKVTDARTLAGQIGLARAMRKFDLRRTISFHSRVAWARSFAASVPEVLAWMPARTRPTGTPWSRYISGEMPSGERDTLLGRFRELGRGERGLLANARCLTEGVDVPAIDGVAFIDPRRSQIDIVQAVGRAIRKSPEKKVGTIVLPVFIEKTSDPTRALDSTAFKPIWDVLRALRSHDEELGEQLDGLRRDLGRRSAGRLRLPRKIRFDLPVAIDHRFVHALDVSVIERTTAGWEFWFGLLQRFVARERHAIVTARHEEEGAQLGGWVHGQRQLHARGALSAERAQRLMTIRGWTWDAQTAAWEEGLTSLRTYVAREGHARVPPEWKESGYRLGQWVEVQRSRYRREEMPADRAKRLEALAGWTWEARAAAWEERFTALKAFAERKRHVRMPYGHREAGLDLRTWISEQRTARARGRLAEDRIRRLEALPGWTWSPHTSAWERGYQALRAFARHERHTRVPGNHQEHGLRLQSWLTEQRIAQANGKLAAERARMLEALPGWAWDPRSAAWDGAFERLRAFVAHGGSARVPRTNREEPFLGTWITHQRTLRNRGSLPVTRARKLEALPGWTWDPHEAAWSSGLDALKAFVARERHARVPAKHLEGTFRLGQWVGAQRSAKSRGQLPHARAGRLEALPGWTWAAHGTAWEEAFQALKAFVRREGHARVPLAHLEDEFHLGHWVGTQRGLYQRGLDEQRRRALERVRGWAWNATASAAREPSSARLGRR